MTRQHNQQYKCINCGCWTTVESSFGRWIRNNPNLDSSKGYCIVDQDYWIHKFMIDGSRKHQLMMWVEIKTMGSELSDAQRDTLYKVDHIFKRNGCKEPLLVNSARNGKVDRSATTYLHVFGIHVLRLSGLGPDDSDQIWWDKHPEPIDEEMLTVRSSKPKYVHRRLRRLKVIRHFCRHVPDTEPANPCRTRAHAPSGSVRFLRLGLNGLAFLVPSQMFCVCSFINWQ